LLGDQFNIDLQRLWSYLEWIGAVTLLLSAISPTHWESERETAIHSCQFGQLINKLLTSFEQP